MRLVINSASCSILLLASSIVDNKSFEWLILLSIVEFSFSSSAAATAADVEVEVFNFNSRRFFSSNELLISRG